MSISFKKHDNKPELNCQSCWDVLAGFKIEAEQRQGNRTERHTMFLCEECSLRLSEGVLSVLCWSAPAAQRQAELNAEHD
jgi:hypothetical protein